MSSVIERVLLLQEIEFFSFAYTEHLSQLAAICHEEELKKGATLFSAGDPCADLHLLVHGKVNLDEKGQQASAERCVLDFWSFFAQRPHRYTASAVEDCRILRVSFDDMVDLLTAEPEFCWAILRHISCYVRDSNGGSS